MPQNPPQIFLAHANEDKPKVRELYTKLVEAGYKPWLDEEDLLPGQNRKEEIPKALRNSDIFIACFSSTSISKRGYIQREFKMAMEMLAEFPPRTIYLIPLKFDECEIPELRQSDYLLNLRDIQWLDYGQPNGFEKLIKSIEYQCGNQKIDSLENEKNRTQEASTKIDWGAAPAVDIFFGRTQELSILEKWIVEDSCRLVAIVGMGGIGKTHFSLKFCRGGIGKTDLSLTLAKKIQNEFEYIIWKSLQNAPPVEKVLLDLIKFLSNQQEFYLPNNLEDKVSLLLQYFQQKRCLLILDNVEGIMKGGEGAGEYLEGYEDYGKILRQVGQRQHKSCLLVTSREIPQEFSELEGKKLPVRIFPLFGLEEYAARQIFTTIGCFSGSDEEWKRIINFYHGNPLAIKIIAKYIHKYLNGNLSQFINEENPIFGNLRELLDWHFERFSIYEKEVMYWLAINQESVSSIELKKDILFQKSKKNLPTTLQSLEQRVPIERSKDGRFTLQPVLLEYMRDRLVEEVSGEIKTGKITLFKNHALLKAQGPDYVRETQKRLIIKPLVDRFKDFDIDIENQLDKILSNLPKPCNSSQKTIPAKPSYAAGNILNLFCYLDINLTGYDFSNLAVWQAYLQGVNLRNTKFVNCNLTNSIFTQTPDFSLSIALSHNDRLLAMGNGNGHISLWTVAGYRDIDIRYIRTIKAHTEWVYSLAFSPNDRSIVSGSYDKTVKIWTGDFETGQYDSRTFVGHTGRVRSVAFSSDGQLIASGSEDKTVRVWNIKSGECKILEGHTERINSVAFSPDDKFIVVGSGGHKHKLSNHSSDAPVRVWNLETSEYKLLQGHTSWVLSVAFHPKNNRTIISGSKDGSLKIWTHLTSQKYTEQTLLPLENSKGIWSLTYSNNGNLVATGHEDGRARIWNLKQNKCVQIFEGHSQRVIRVAFSSDATTLITLGEDRQLIFWNASNGQRLKTIQAHNIIVLSVAFSRNNKYLLSGGSDGIVRLWDLDNNKCIKALSGHSSWVWSVAFSPDDKRIASGGEDDTVRLWHLNEDPNPILMRHTSWVMSVAFSHDGKYLASSSDDQIVKIWDLEKLDQENPQQRDVPVNSGLIRKAVFHPKNSHMIATCGQDESVKIWNLREGNKVSTLLKGHTAEILSVSFSSDGKYIASSSADQTVKIWDTINGNCINTLRQHTDRVRSVLFSPDNKYLASCSDDKTVKFWDVENIEKASLIKDWQAHDDRIWSFAFSHDSKYIATCSSDQLIKLWDIQRDGNPGSPLILKFKPYEGMDITNIDGLSKPQISILKALGAIETGIVECSLGSQRTEQQEQQDTTINQGDSQPSIGQEQVGARDNVAGNENAEALELWQDKLAAYRREEAIASDPEKKFQLKALIKECLGKIEELGG